jgi:Flp pilus assembly protein TadG
MIGERGQAAVEFALAIPIALLLLFGTLDLARAVWQTDQLAYAAREGARYAIVHGASSDSPSGPGNDSAVRDVVLRQTTVVGNAVAAVTYAPANARGDTVTVTVTSAYRPLPLLNGSFSITLRGTSSQVIQQ